MYLGEYQINDYVELVANTHRFTTGAAYDANPINYRVYEEGNNAEIIADTPMSKFDSETGFFYERLQLTAAAGFEKNKSYVALITATVDGVTAKTHRIFRVEPSEDVAPVQIVTVET